jgi:hypothetical protein
MRNLGWPEKLNLLEERKIIDLSSLKQNDKNGKYFNIDLGSSSVLIDPKKFNLNVFMDLQDHLKDVIILNEGLGEASLSKYLKDVKLMQEFIYTELYKRWYFVPNNDGPYDWMILPYDYPYGAKPVNGINQHPFPNGADKSLNEIPIDIHIIANVIDFAFELWKAYWQLYTRYTPEQSVKHFVNLIYEWLVNKIPSKIYRMPEYNPDDYAVLENTDTDREDYWRLYRWIRWYAEAIVLNIPDSEKNMLDGNAYIKTLVHDLVKYFNDHHGKYAPFYVPEGTQYNKIKGRRHKWLTQLKKLF